MRSRKKSGSVKQVERHFDVEIGPDLPVADRLLQQRSTLGAPSEHEVVAKRLRKLRLQVRGGDHRGDVPSGRRREALRDRPQLAALARESRSAGLAPAPAGFHLR